MTLNELRAQNPYVYENVKTRFDAIGLRDIFGINWRYMFFTRFGDREVFTDNADKFNDAFNLRATVSATLWKNLITKYNDIINNIITPSGTKTTRTYPAPNGVVDTSYVLGMIEEEETGTGDEDLNRLIRIDEFKNAVEIFLNEFEPLFIGVWTV